MAIRRTPEDFIVEERLTPAAQRAIEPATDAAPRARYALYRLTKTSITTPDAVAALARAVGVRAGHVEAAGLKDKHAVTTQHVTVRTEGAPGAASMARQIAGNGWSGALIGWTATPAAASWIERNHFTIVARNLTGEACDEMDRRATLLRAAPDSDDLLFVNYFGDQRFGSARHGQGFAARRLLRAEFEQALRLLIATPARKDTGKRREFTRLAAAEWGNWKSLVAKLPRCPERAPIERLASGADFREAFGALPHFLQTMCVEAYQSHLWNATARRLARTIGAPSEGAAPRAAHDALIVTDDPFGEMVFPGAGAVAGEWRTLEIPMLARDTALREPWADAARAALAEEGLTLAQLRIPGVRRPAFGEAMRPLFVRAAEFTMSPPAPDELSAAAGRLKRTLTFALPRGAYATVALRALGH